MSIQKIYVAGGCFWCMNSPFDLKGVKKVTSGYMGGHVTDPTYKEVKTQVSGHYEVVEIQFDDEEITLERILNSFWRNIDPTDPDGQFHDRGSSYRTAIFYITEDHKLIAEKSKSDLDKTGRFNAPIVTQVIEAGTFYEAEEYHQDYHLKQPDDYEEDRSKSGRDEFIKKHWGEDYWDFYE
ncbi:MAG: peptide-methionine (S)-S-oxide reductase MsrA [Clostridiales bacterium]|nr:peptide-methionine (S)-S-oxide reductase MsrA [Clostridiales bacterium]